MVRAMPQGKKTVDTDDKMPAQVAIPKVGTPAKKNKVKVYTWTCQYCGQSFETEYYSQRYCNPTHKQYAYLERKRQKTN